jgi:hypothetical protein
MAAVLALTAASAEVLAQDAPGEAAEEAEPEESVDDARPEAGQSMWTPRRKIALGLAATGVTAVIVGVGFGLSAQAYADAAWESCPTEPCMDAEALGWGETSHSRATIANAMFVGGGILVGSAVAIWFLGAPADDDDDGAYANLVPVVSPDQAGAALVGRW